jgi:hypothetical protein
MSNLPSSFQLGLELTNIFPIREVVRNISNPLYAKILSFARDLRKSGSDLLVEEDLAAIFGRALINRDLEESFRKDVIQNSTIVPFHNGCSLVLDPGPGPTISRALQPGDRYYLSTVIQLSFLCWTHSRTSIAAGLVECMQRRVEMNVEGASTDPTFEGISGTLEACSSQTSTFAWSNLIQQVEGQIKQSYSEFKHQKDYISLSPSTLLAGMDYLCMVQRWKESRRVEISNQKGFLTMIVWAHCILGLSVVVKGLPGGDVLFASPDDTSRQVTIMWNFEGNDPEVCLLDSKNKVVLRTTSDDIELRELDACERLPLLGFGSVLLHREFNASIITVPENSPLLEESVQQVMSMAILIARKLVRYKGPDHTICAFDVQPWQIFDAGSIIFNGLPIGRNAINSYLEYVRKNFPEMPSIWSLPMPPALSSYLKQLNPNGDHILPINLRLIRLAVLVVVMASVSNIADCAKLPLLSDTSFLECVGFTGAVQRNKGAVTCSSSDLFYMFCQMLVGLHFITEESSNDNGSFMVSDFGWTVYLPSFGDHDPASTISERLFVRKGVPTNPKSGERKNRVCDAISLGSKDSFMPCRQITDRGTTYTPRCLSRVIQRTEYYGSRKDSFHLDIAFKVHEQVQLEGDIRKFDLHSSYSRFHAGLWNTVFTPPCSHEIVAGRSGNSVTKLGPGVVAGTGLDWDDETESSAEVPERICVLLVRGDRRSRWLAVENAANSDVRSTILRTTECCDDCAVEVAAKRRGKWLVIL